MKPAPPWSSQDGGSTSGTDGTKSQVVPIASHEEMVLPRLKRRQAMQDPSARKARVMIGFLRFLEEEDGPTAVEYAVMLALIIAVCFVAITSLGTSANSVFANDALKTAVGS
jgi:pilus assembly protein Flp/PilA